MSAMWGLWFLSHKYEAAEIRIGDWAFRIMEKRGQSFEVWITLAFLTVTFAGGLAYELRERKAFQKSRKKPLYWLHLTLGYLAFIVLSQFGVLIYGQRVHGAYSEKHHVYYDVMLRSIFAIALIIAGILLYLFKKYSKLLYGLSEIVLAVISNIALIERADISHLSTMTPKTSDILAFVVFTYLLSRGVSNAVEGVQERLDRSARIETGGTEEDGYSTW